MLCWNIASKTIRTGNLIFSEIIISQQKLTHSQRTSAVELKCINLTGGRPGYNAG